MRHKITFIPKYRPRVLTTTHDIHYKTHMGEVIIIPAGTKYTPALNLAPSIRLRIKYWAEKWPNMSPEAESWEKTYGFGLTAKDVKK